MDIKNLITLRTIVDTGSFQAAANQLNYAQSTVTAQVQQLEQELGLQLFTKTGRKMVLTQAGRDLMPQVQQVLGTVTAMKNYGRSDARLTGELRVALPDTLLTYKMQPVIAEFHRQLPGVQLSLQRANCFRIPQKVRAATVDLGVHYDVGGYGPKLRVTKLGIVPMALVGSPDLHVDADALRREHVQLPVSLLTDDVESIYHKQLVAHLRQRDQQFASLLEIGSVEATKRSVLNGLGMAYLPRFVVQAEIATGTLREFATGMDLDSLQIVVIRRDNQSKSRLTDAFMRILRAELGPVSGD
ncbi:MAG: LysR family transcriptional regulator [Lacticaseibacillus songhuajiangensis]|jgi:DNA-binding transcriptional LysR family regulator|nr:LysR family transcriptional regulator [Lacticaseibacillus songhuajiangensis]